MSKISGYAALASVQTDDVLLINDVHDTSMAPTGTTKQATVKTLLAATMSVQAATAAAGFALANSTSTILTWTTPNDGLVHTALVTGTLQVTGNETGGLVQIGFFPPAGAQQFIQLFAAGQATGIYAPFTQSIEVKANTAVTVQQTSALTVGAATLWSKIYGA